MASLADRLRTALTQARKSRDQARTLLFSTILADLKNRELELARTASDDETADVLRRGITRRREAAEQFDKVGAGERGARERAEAATLEAFLPEPAQPDEIRRAVREAIAAGAKDLGKVMGQVMPRFKGRADGKVVNQIVREELSATV